MVPRVSGKPLISYDVSAVVIVVGFGLVLFCFSLFDFVWVFCGFVWFCFGSFFCFSFVWFWFLGVFF